VLLGVDVGGTFTDAVLVDGVRVVTAKAPTTPDDQSEGVLAAIAAALDSAGAQTQDVELFAHGMTVATNALLEGRGARTVLLATEGFTDVVELGRQARAELYRLCAAHPAPLVPAERRVAVPERMGPDGVVRALEDPAAVATAAAAHEPEALAVCLLHADRHPAHEQALGEALAQELPGIHVSLSHEVVGTFREYERAATTEVDAALSPLLAGYLRAMIARARDAGLPEPSIMQSSGGLTDATGAAAHAAFTVLSGPAGGAAAAMLVAQATDEPNLLCFDMGGTSCDVCVVQDGTVRETAGREVGGRALALRMVDIHTVGAGGGSIGWVDPGGALRAGPQSAGAVPGPACYGRGGEDPTVTDAHLVLGHLDAQTPLAGGVTLDADAARAAVGRLAQQLDLSVEDCAAGIIRVADAEMLRALRVMTVEQGIDPRSFALLAFGGAGPLHACDLADELQITRVIVPRAGGVLSALGLAAADRRRDEAQTVLLRDITDAALAELAQDADEVAWDVRYVGQSFELTVRDVADFHAVHEERYGYADPDAAIELVTVRRTWREPGPQIDLRRGSARPRATGPDVLRLPETTIVVAEGWTATEDDAGTIRLERA
jgi:N-methylhydantoinase A/oxoprolinase/acetone carboxylase beta subunit